MKLGKLEIENKYILAPLENVSTGPYRRFCRKIFDIGLVYVPMVHTKRLMSSPKSFDHELHKIEEERPISVQIIGSESESLVKAIDYLESYKFDVLDINAGCPSRRAIKLKKGGYLLKDLLLLKELLETALKYSSRPVSLKTRVGFHNSDNIEEIAKLANESGIEFITVHARPVTSRYNVNSLDLNAVKRLKELLTIPLIGNGDIDSPESAKHFIDYTNVDAIMIGRASIGNPGIFRRIDSFLSKGEIIPFENNLTVMKQNIGLYEETIDQFLEGISLKHGNEEFKYLELKRNAIWLTKNIEDSTILRENLSKTKNLNQLKKKLEDCFNNKKN